MGNILLAFVDKPSGVARQLVTYFQQRKESIQITTTPMPFISCSAWTISGWLVQRYLTSHKVYGLRTRKEHPQHHKLLKQLYCCEDWTVLANFPLLSVVLGAA